MFKVGMIGWRGMVGSVLMQRMAEENDWAHCESFFFSTSQAGQKVKIPGCGEKLLLDAVNLSDLSKMDILLTCQGGDYTSEIFSKLRDMGWGGYWIDAASTLRMQSDAIIVLDPVNGPAIKEALARGVNNLIGGNCTVSLMLMAMQGLLQADEVEWISSMTYQAVSGAGAQSMRELVSQMNALQQNAGDSHNSILELEARLHKTIQSPEFPTSHIGYPLAGSLIPWIDKEMIDGQSREEWKGNAETNKILCCENRPIVVDGICVRVGVLRCHSQALTVCLKKDLPIAQIEEMLQAANNWVKIIPNRREESSRYLTPAAISGTLDVAVGRLRKLKIGSRLLSVFTCGDQLLWGAAEPLRRALRMVLQYRQESQSVSTIKYQKQG